MSRGWFFAVVVCSCCARTPPPPVRDLGQSPAIAPSWSPTHEPVVLRVEPMDPSVTGTVSLRVEVVQLTPFDLPLRVEVSLPNGVTVLRGETRYVVPTGPRPRDDRRVLVLACGDRAPADDLVVTAEARDDDHGVHAEARFRFGRPEPTTPAPPLSRRPLRIGNVDHGAPIDMTPATPVTPSDPPRGAVR